MKHGFSEGEPDYLRARREIVARPGANLLAGILLSAASVFGVAMIVPESEHAEGADAPLTRETATVQCAAPCGVAARQGAVDPEI